MLSQHLRERRKLSGLFLKITYAAGNKMESRLRGFYVDEEIAVIAQAEVNGDAQARGLKYFAERAPYEKRRNLVNNSLNSLIVHDSKEGKSKKVKGKS